MVKIVEPSVEIITEINGDKILKTIERAARTCYKTEDNISEDASSAKKMISKLIEMGHTAMIEFADVHVILTADTGVLKDLTRHRHCSFAVESTRYCNYSKGKFGNEITVIKPCNIEEGTKEYDLWLDCMNNIETTYNQMAELGCKPDQLRMLLPHSLKCNINLKANVREWRHIFSLRCAKAAHPSVQEIMKMVLVEFHKQIPILFDDLYEKFILEK
jgi:thymidylate synthase (FAD)